MEDKYKWLRQYAKPCMKQGQNLEELPNIKTIEGFLKGDYSREKVLDYFMTIHNLRALRNKNYVHLLIPYEVMSTEEHCVTGAIREPFFQELPIPLCNISFGDNKLNKARDSGIIISRDRVLLSHFSELVDSCSHEELEKYHYLYAQELVLK